MPSRASMHPNYLRKSVFLTLAPKVFHRSVNRVILKKGGGNLSYIDNV